MVPQRAKYLGYWILRSDKEDENDELMNDSDTEFITLEEIELTQTTRVF